MQYCVDPEGGAHAGPETKAGAAKPSIAGESAELIDARALTAEEQMARFEEALKESDWGHQPC